MIELKNRSGVLLAGALAVLVGGVVLLGWALDIAALKSVLPGWVSMKPNTALAFILTGIALLSSSTLMPSLSRFSALCAGLIGLLSLCEYAFGWNPGFDQWLFPEPAGTVGTSHPGRMAPDTAICFALLAAGLEFVRRARQTTQAQVAALILGTLVLTIALLEMLSYFTPVLRTYGWGGLTMMALPTATVFAALGAALILIAWPENRPVPAAPDTSSEWLFLGVFLLLAAGIVATGTFYYRYTERKFHAESERQLDSIAELKVGELVQYRNERLGDANLLNDNPAFTQLVRRVLTSPADADAQRQLQAWLGKYQTSYQYDQVRLLDVQGVTRLSAPTGLGPVGSAIVRGATEALRTGQVAFQDFYRNEHDQRIYLALLIPVLDEADGNRPLGVFVLRIDPATYLYPFIRRWPVPSATAETLLVRREGNEVVFLNELRFQTNTALTLRSSLANTSMPAVKAALGQKGIVTGSDYRGSPVLASMRSIPDSPWFLVARQDLAEVYAPLRTQLWQVIVLVGVLIFGAGAGVELVWRRQHARFHQEKAESAASLREAQDILQAAMDHSPAGIAIANAPDGGLRYINNVGLCICGDDRERIVNGVGIDQYVASWQLLDLDGRTLKPEEVPLARAILFGETNHHEFMIRRTANDDRIVSAHAAPIRDAGGNVIAGIMVFTDITKRKQTDDALRQSRQAALNMMKDAIEARNQSEQMSHALRASETTFKAVAALSPMAIYASIGSEQNAVFINDAFYKIFGFTIEDVPTVGHWWIKAFPDEKYRQQIIDQWTYNIEQANKNNADVEALECVCTCKDGSEKNIAWVGKTIGDEFWAFGYDFSERKQAEEEILKLNAQLELRVVERTARLEAANKELEAFSYSVSHDLRAPLRAMDGFSAALLEDCAGHLDATSMDHLRRIRAGSQRMAVLIDDLLNLSRESRAEMQRERVDLTALARRIGAGLQRAQPDRPTEWVVAPAMAAEADARMLDVVLTNLLGNAWKFTGQRAGARIEVGALAARTTDLTDKVPQGLPASAATVFFVRDNGVGFDMAYADKLFGAFQRLHSKQEFEGMGIGLALVQRIIHRHRGRVWAEGEIGKGATFYFTLGNDGS